ncbi:MAG: hypothetical protein HDS14_08360 [Bacteroides sp.]|nr:hypothetical protein [Bacteroides sp.]
MKTDNFLAIKKIIIERAKQAKACTPEYARAYKSETLPELMQVIKDNFNWCCSSGTIDTELILQYRDEFAEYDIFANIDVTHGFLLCGNATVKACGNATVKAYGNATVKAYGNATVEAYGNATVEAYGNATVEACGNATVKAYDNATVKAYDNATVEAYGNAYCMSYSVIECKLSDRAIHRVVSTNTIYYSDDELKFEKRS